MNRGLAEKREEQNKNIIIDLLVVLCIAGRFGFPGNLASVVNASLHSAYDYGTSFLQIVIMLLASGDSVLDIKLFDFKKKYLMIYEMLVLMYVMSMLVTFSKTEQLVMIIRFSITVFFGLWLADHYKPEEILTLIYYAQAIVVAANLLVYFVFRGAGFHYDEGYGYTYRGIFVQKNGLGGELACGLALQAALMKVKRMREEPLSRTFILVFLAQIFLLVISKATGSLFSGIFSMMYVLLYDKIASKELRIQWGMFYTIVSIGFLFAAITILPIFEPLLEAIGKDATLSNRTPMWRGIIGFLQNNNTLTGYGLLMFWENQTALQRLRNSFGRNSWYRTMAFGSHNTILETWLDVGLIGLATYLGVLIYSFRGYKKMMSEQYVLCSAIMFTLMVKGLTERSYGNAGYTTLFLFVALGVACSVDNRKNRQLRYTRGA